MVPGPKSIMTSLFKTLKKLDGELRFKDGTHVPLPKIVSFIKNIMERLLMLRVYQWLR